MIIDYNSADVGLFFVVDVIDVIVDVTMTVITLFGYGSDYSTTLTYPFNISICANV